MTQHANPVSGEKVFDRTLSIAEKIYEEDKDSDTNLRFAMDCYRLVMDLIKIAPKFDGFYHETAQRAFAFCDKNELASEFKRVCENMKWHHQQIIRFKNKNKSTTGLLRPDTYLDTKAKQLKTSCRLKLWRCANDIVDEMEAFGVREHAPAIENGAAILGGYYEGNAEVLWYCKGSDVEHAEALWKLFGHQRRVDPTFSGSDAEQRLADTLVLATAAAASSASLLEIISRKGVKNVASAEVGSLLDYLHNGGNHPEICRDVTKYLSAIETKCESDAGILRYFPKVKEIALTKLINLLQDVYQTISLDRLRNDLVPPEFMEWHDAEFVLMNLSKTGGVSVVIDNFEKTVTFSYSRSRFGAGHNLFYDTATAIHRVVGQKQRASKGAADTQAKRILTFYTSIQAKLEEDSKFFKERMEYAQETLERETEAAKEENDELRQADVRRREEMQRKEAERQERAALREKEQKAQKQLFNQRLVIAKKILASIIHEMPNIVNPVKIRGVDINKLDVNAIAQQKYTYEEISAALQKMKDKERQAIRSVREKEEKSVDYTARAIREESIPLWQQSEQIMNQHMEEEAASLNDAAAEQHAAAYESIENLAKTVQEFGYENFEKERDYIAGFYKDEFSEQWPAFKKKVNSMILKQAVVGIKSRVPAPSST